MSSNLERLREKFLKDQGPYSTKNEFGPTEFEERQRISDLIQQGYTVIVQNPWGTNFNEKYKVVKSGTDKVAVLDQNNQVVGEQG